MSITIRTVQAGDADALAHVLVTAEQYTFKGLVPEQCLQFTETESAANWKRSFAKGFLGEHDIFLVAETDRKKVVGFAWGMPSDKMPGYGGELKTISILPDYHRQGIGRRLVGHIAGELNKQGISSLWLRVLQVNPNRRFYERLDGKNLDTGLYNWDGVDMIESIYGWKNTEVLIGKG